MKNWSAESMMASTAHLCTDNHALMRYLSGYIYMDHTTSNLVQTKHRNGMRLLPFLYLWHSFPPHLCILWGTPMDHPTEHTKIIPKSGLLRMQPIFAHGICEQRSLPWHELLPRKLSIENPIETATRLNFNPAFVLHLSLLIFTERQVQAPRIQ